MHKRKIALIAAGVLAAMGITGGAIAQDSASPPGDTPPLAFQAGGYAEPVSGPDAAQRGSFGVLRRARTGNDSLDQVAAQAIASGFQDSLGANPAQSRRALTTDAGATLYVLPAHGAVCLTSSAGVDTCNTTEAAREGYVLITSGIGIGGARIAGMTPDGVETVTLAMKDGSQLTTKVSDNVYAFEIAGTPDEADAVAWDDGTWVHRISVPSSSAK
jgi:hypothetical protein